MHESRSLYSEKKKKSCFLFLFLLLKELWIIIFKIIFKMTPSIQKKDKNTQKIKKNAIKKTTQYGTKQLTIVYTYSFSWATNKEFRYKTIKGKKSW